MKINIGLSDSHLSGKEYKYIKQALDANQVSNYGENISCLEKTLEAFLEKNYKVACLSSGTGAIHLALILAGVKKDDEVLCQSMTFSASANPILYLGANPVFIDSENETWNMCPNYLEEAIEDRIFKSEKPKAIIVVHSYGMPAKISEIVAVAEKYEIPLIEDTAEALGSSYKGQKCGTFGDFVILSFNGNKIITTSGGGALATRDKEIKNKAIFLATQAKENAPHYQHSEIGYNYRMSNILAGIGRGQMEVIDKHISLRRSMNIFYKEIFKDVKGVSVFQEPNTDYFSNHWLSCILIESKITGFTRDDLRIELSRKNIESRPLWKPMHLQPIFKDYPFYGSNVSESLFNNGLCLPSGSNLTKKEKALIAKTILDYINH
ncbi:aminotransferase class I/II-fold pyridoxal phosphate-dependent enzyme [Algibacter aquimarinus]|uniref:DegT/DnrJ/EryC1/StrS family aminotransferase n=1 Tax=Algibacter aquimarinus TaxID=1136748 RepID=A0ABP9HCQ5_9FLAO